MNKIVCVMYTSGIYYFPSMKRNADRDEIIEM